MLIRKALVVAVVLAVVGLALSTPTRADTFARTNYITFSQPVRLPGAVLGSGTYIFELTDPMGAPDAVSVFSRDHRRVYFSGLTRTIERPAGMPRSQVVSLDEARADAARPIRVWWLIGEAYGREFTYPGR